MWLGFAPVMMIVEVSGEPSTSTRERREREREKELKGVGFINEGECLFGDKL